MTFKALPYPVSQSAMTGMLTASTIFRSMASCSLESMKLASGMHFIEAEMAKPLAQMPSKPARSIRRALKASWAPTILIAPGLFRAARSFAAFVIGAHHAKAADSCQWKVCG